MYFRPMGCAMKANILAAWRNYFVLEEHMLEVTYYSFTLELLWIKKSGCL